MRGLNPENEISSEALATSDKLDPRFKKALMSGKNIFLTGGAGVGKSFNIKALKEIEGLDVDFTASTGIAALNIGGSTIHRFAGLGIEKGRLAIDKITRRRTWGDVQERLIDVQTLVLDEVSMIRSDVLELLDEIFQTALESGKPFGGKQVVFVGDGFQIPPVIRSDERILAPWFFQCDAWLNADIEIVELTKIYRQTDEKFIKALNNFRQGITDPESVDLISSRNNAELKQGVIPVYLVPLNKEANAINERFLAEIQNPIKSYPVEVSVEPDMIPDPYEQEKIIDNVYKDLGFRQVELKVGAKVVITVNHPNGDYCNGSTGIVEDLTPEYISIRLDVDDSVCDIKFREIELTDKHDRKYASIKLMPVKLAWALTIHRAQGMSLDFVDIDFSKMFVAGQSYVALSRVRSLEGLRVRNWKASKIFSDTRVSNFYALNKYK